MCARARECVCVCFSMSACLFSAGFWRESVLLDGVCVRACVYFLVDIIQPKPDPKL